MKGGLWKVTALCICVVLAVVVLSDQMPPVPGLVAVSRPSPATGEPPVLPGSSTSSTQTVIERSEAADKPAKGREAEGPSVVAATKWQRAQYRLLRMLAKQHGTTLPPEEALGKSQWVELQAVHAAFAGELATLESRRVMKLGLITDRKVADGSMERVTDGPPQPATLKAVSKATRPQFVGQQVQVQSGPSGTLVNRVNPGEDAELDSIAESISTMRALYVDAASRILGR